MKIYQRTALNKEFYDYRNSALRRMRRIGEDNNLFVDRHERARLEYARSEFYIVSAVYYYYLQQRSEALDNIGQLKEAELASDTSQLLYYYYIKVQPHCAKPIPSTHSDCWSLMLCIKRGGSLREKVMSILKATAYRDWST